MESSEFLEGDPINKFIPIVFREIRKDAVIIEPRSNQKLRMSVFYRFDPLTENMSVIFPSESYKTRLFTNQTDWDLVKTTFDQTRKNCPFCPERREHSVPKFTNIRNLSRGEAYLFPNLFPQWEYHAVIALTSNHTILPSEFSEEQFFNGFLLALDYFRSLKNEENISYASINMNYLMPAGATLSHPHFQVLAGELPSNWQKMLILRSEEYFKTNNSNYWDDLADTEKKKGLRFLGEVQDVSWFVPFAPKSSYEVRAFFHSSNLLKLSNKSIKAFSKKLKKILEFFQCSQNFSSYNFSLIGCLNDNYQDTFSIIFSLIPRQNLYNNYRSEYNYMSSIQNTRFISKSPELYATEIRDKVFFDNRSG